MRYINLRFTYLLTYLLAFRRAAATLASLPRPVTSLQDVNSQPSIGEHSKRVIKVSFL